MYTIAEGQEPFQIAIEGGSETTQGRAVELWAVPSLKLFLHYRGQEFCLTEARTGRLFAKGYTEIMLWGIVQGHLEKHKPETILARIRAVKPLHDT